MSRPAPASRRPSRPDTAANPFASAADALGLGVDALFNTPEQFAPVALDAISVRAQVRETFETDTSTLEELAASIKARGVLQPVLVRPVGAGFELIAGERRLRAARQAGLSTIPAYIRDLTDEEAEDAQLAENIQRLNLSQIEEAKKIQRDLDRLGSVEAVLAKHQKSHAWLSKILALLNLPEQAKRLVTEHVSADVEVINTVKTIEKVDPEAARLLVDDLRATRGRASARAKAAAVKARVKPGKRERTTPATGARIDAVATGGDTPPHGLPSPSTGGVALVKIAAMRHLVGNVMAPAHRHAYEEEAASAQAQGRASEAVGTDVLRGLRQGIYAGQGIGALRLAAFLQGVQGRPTLSLPELLASMDSESRPLPAETYESLARSDSGS